MPTLVPGEDMRLNPFFIRVKVTWQPSLCLTVIGTLRLSSVLMFLIIKGKASKITQKLFHKKEAAWKVRVSFNSGIRFSCYFFSIPSFFLFTASLRELVKRPCWGMTFELLSLYFLICLFSSYMFFMILDTASAEKKVNFGFLLSCSLRLSKRLNRKKKLQKIY